MSENNSEIYINEIIRITYKCNWKCSFCNVSKVNNFGENDISYKEVIYKILNLTKKYTKQELKLLNLSFSWGEPTINKHLLNYIRLAKNIWVWIIELQTNWTTFFKDHKYTDKLINSWLNNIFMAHHSNNDLINKKLWVYYNINDFYSWVKYSKENNLKSKIDITLNIVITKINLFYVYDFIVKLLEIDFFSIMPEKIHSKRFNKIISFWLVQPNWYAEKNKEKILLKYDNIENKEIKKIVDFCENNKIFPDFHFTAPPLCILNYPEYNLEYNRLKKLEIDRDSWSINKWNLESYKNLWKEKIKFKECKECKYNNYCLGFYKNWISFVWEEYVKERINNFLNNSINAK